MNMNIYIIIEYNEFYFMIIEYYTIIFFKINIIVKT